MGNLVELVESLEDKVGKLLKIRKQQSEKLVSLQDELAENKQQIETLHEQIELLQGNNKSLKAANALLGSNEYKKETKLKINSLIREIDSCIVQLSE